MTAPGAGELAARLRAYIDDDHDGGCQGRCYACECGYDATGDDLLREAASRIEALEAENARLRKALGSAVPLLVNSSPGGCDGHAYDCERCEVIRNVRAALGEAAP